MHHTVYFDFETRSTCDLKKSGADTYARDLNTDILCIGYAIDDYPAKVSIGGGFPEDLKPYLYKGNIWVAHNAPFDLSIWKHVACDKYDWKKPLIKQIHCTLSMAYAMSLPGSLEELCRVLKLPHQKDMKASRTMLQLAKPRSKKNGELTWWDPNEFSEKYEILHKYCVSDIEALRSVYKKLFKLSDFEQSVWQNDFIINQRGVSVDIDAVKRARVYAKLEKKRLDAKISELTEGRVPTCSSVMKLSNWLKTEGYEFKSLGKNDVAQVLKSDRLNPKVRQVLLTRQEAAKSSTAKLEAMLNRLCPDGKLRSLFQYHGASTGRWAGRGVQFQNLPRPNLTADDIERVIYLLKNERGLDELI